VPVEKKGRAKQAKSSGLSLTWYVHKRGPRMLQAFCQREKDLASWEVAQCNRIAREHRQELGTLNAFAEMLRFRSLGILQVKQKGSVYVLGRTEQLPAGDILGLPFQI